MSTGIREAQRHALLQLAEALLACEDSGVTVRCHDGREKPATFSIFVSPCPGLVACLYDGSTNASPSLMNYGAVELAVEELVKPWAR